MTLQRVLVYAVASRLLTLTLVVTWRLLLSPYDTSASINPPCLSFSDHNRTHPPKSTLPLARVGSAIEESVVWDGVYFTRVAQCGYEYEQSYAFLPLLPLCISFLSNTVFAPLIRAIGYRAVLALSGYVINNVTFVLAAMYLYRLSVVVLKDRDKAFRAAILFCFNPASIFYSSIYSESLYAFLSFGGLYHFIKGSDIYATFCFALSGFARSNGVLNAGYMCYRALQQVSVAFLHNKRNYPSTLKSLLVGAVRCLFIFTPFISFQAFGFFNLCMGRSSDELRPWCKARLPLLYNYIQSHYWGVGFLKYFQIKQLPNFLLASPILSLALFSIAYYVKLWPEVFLSVGLHQTSKENKFSGSSSSMEFKGLPPADATATSLQDHGPVRQRKTATKREKSITEPSKSQSLNSLQCDPTVILPFVLHLGFMVTTAFFVMHVQVSTRFLSASPVLYWFASHVMASPHAGKKWGYLIWAYCAAYILLGTLLFSNFYPFT